MPDYLEYFKLLLIKTPPILLALTVHEAAHAWTSKRLGDNTAYLLGRVSLNPIKHLDPIGTAMLFLSGMFGWAKPVPVNPMNFKEPSRGMMLVSIAGPGANLILAVLSAVVYKFMIGFESSIFAFPSLAPMFFMVKVSIIINIGLAIFNMIPVPPLDGSKVLAHFLPADKAFVYSRLEPYGFLVLILLIFTGIIDAVISPFIRLAYGLLVNGGI